MTNELSPDGRIPVTPAKVLSSHRRKPEIPVTPAKAGVQVFEGLDSGFRRNDEWACAGMTDGL
jgi:hypothetical protein